MVIYESSFKQEMYSFLVKINFQQFFSCSLRLHTYIEGGPIIVHILSPSRARIYLCMSSGRESISRLVIFSLLATLLFLHFGFFGVEI